MKWQIQDAERKKKDFQPRILCWVKPFFKNEEEIKAFPNKQKLREFVVSKPALHETLQRVHQAEMKGP